MARAAPPHSTREERPDRNQYDVHHRMHRPARPATRPAPCTRREMHFPRASYRTPTPAARPAFGSGTRAIRLFVRFRCRCTRRPPCSPALSLNSHLSLHGTSATRRVTRATVARAPLARDTRINSVQCGAGRGRGRRGGSAALHAHRRPPPAAAAPAPRVPRQYRRIRIREWSASWYAARAACDAATLHHAPHRRGC
ncbi:hypothetical protein EVAR_38797_1 [Eumeta japonica]|uniref:Uncharacterized protein n=1 Tax=Eumeta variegata TaxID=151549 RepID=A0A4C1WK51_EUMVA|nr:hypothetical protein EVAR_38797_1 [Eumeta japonica]